MRLPLILPLAAPLVFLGACQSIQPINAWQQRLTDYTMKEGHGDINILRESAELRSPQSVRPAQIRFDHDDLAQPGIAPFVDHIDVHGVMVGQRTESKHPVFYFLIGVVERPYSRRPPKIEDVRLVSCTVRNGAHQWKTSPPSPAALHKYVTFRSSQNGELPFTGQTFPKIDDDFRFDVRNGVAQATDVRSGATWQMPLN